MEDKNRLARVKRIKRYKVKYKDLDFDLLSAKIYQDVITTSECLSPNTRAYGYRAYLAVLALGVLILVLLSVWTW